MYNEALQQHVGGSELVSINDGNACEKRYQRLRRQMSKVKHTFDRDEMGVVP